MSSYLEKTLEKKREAGKESKAKWAKDNPGRQPGHSLKTWKSYSQQRLTNVEFRRNYESIDWSV